MAGQNQAPRDRGLNAERPDTPSTEADVQSAVIVNGLDVGEAEDLAERALRGLDSNPGLSGWSRERKIDRAVQIVAEIARRRLAVAT